MRLYSIVGFRLRTWSSFCVLLLLLPSTKRLHFRESVGWSFSGHELFKEKTRDEQLQPEADSSKGGHPNEHSNKTAPLQLKRRKLFLFWIEENPGRGKPGKFRYYFDIAYAINTQGAEVEVCESTWRDMQNRSKHRLTIQEQYVYLLGCYQKALAFLKQVDSDPNMHHEAILVTLFPTKLARNIHNDGGGIIWPFVLNLKRLLSDVGVRNDSMLRSNNEGPHITFVFMANMVFRQMSQKMKALTQPFIQQGLLDQSTFEPTVPGLTILASTWSPLAESFQAKYKVPFFFCPFATDTTIFNLTALAVAQIPWNKRPYDVFLRWDTNTEKYRHRREIDLLFTNRSPTSRETKKLLEENTISNIRTLAPTGFMSESQYQKSTASSKMAISTIGIPDKADLLGTRYFEVQASGTTLLLSERPMTKRQQDVHRDYGFIEGETYVAFSNITELVEKIHFYKNHSHEAMQIIRNSQAKADQYGSWSLRGKLYVEKIWQISKRLP